MTKTDNTDLSNQASPATNKRVLVLFAHPSISRSEVNWPLAQATRQVPGITFVDLYAEYPTLDINVDLEQQRLLDHDIIVFMHPLYWYSTPSIFKEWQDLVLEHGFAYGLEGTALHGKIFFNVISMGGPEEAYSSEGFQHFTIRELLHPLEQMAALCGMLYLPPFTLFSARLAVEEQRLQDHINDWIIFLEALQRDEVDIIKAQSLPKLNQDLPTLIKGVT